MQVSCPHCLRSVEVPQGTLVGDEFSCPNCLTPLRITGGIMPDVEYAHIEDDMMWDDDVEMGWADDDDDDDDGEW